MAVSTGNTGIGTSSPANKLVVDCSTGDGITVRNSGSVRAQIYQDGSGYGLFRACDTGGTVKVSLSANASTGSYFSAGNVGIGTTSPSVKVDVAGTDTIGVRYVKSGSKDARIQVGDPGRTWAMATGWSTQGDFSIIEEGVSGNRLYIKQGGNVGINTSSPATPLHVVGVDDSGYKGLRVEAPSPYSGRYLDIIVGMGTTVYSTHGLGIVSDDAIGVYTGGDERINITNTGEIGINTQGLTPSAKLDVNAGTVSGTNPNIRLRGLASSAPSGGDDGNIVLYQNGSTRRLYVRMSSTWRYINFDA